MKKVILIFNLILLLSNCKSAYIRGKEPINSSTYPVGDFRQQDNPSFQLTLNSDLSFLYSVPSGVYGFEGKCCDTISFGKWVIEPNNMIALSTPDYLSKKIPINVEEGFNVNLDTIYFSINNPIEELYFKDRERIRNIQYVVLVFTRDEHLREIANIESCSNIIKLNNSRKEDIEYFQILIYPGSFTYLLEGEIRKSETEIYFPKDHKSNQFKIYIPDLTGNFLKIRKLNRDFVKIINKDELEWDGHLFVNEKK